MSANSLYFGDNVEILRNEINSESVDLTYLDPPFNSKATYYRLFRSSNGHIPQAQFTPQPANNVLFIAGNNHERIFPQKKDAKGERQRVEGSFDDLLERAGIKDFRFHDLRHTFASWYMMNGGDLYELAKILGHSNIKMTERYAKLAKQHIARTSNTAREMWKLLEPISKKEAVG